MFEIKDLVTINFYKNDKVYYSYRTCLYNLMYLTPLIKDNFKGLSYDWYMHPNNFSSHQIFDFIKAKSPKISGDIVWFDIDNFSKDLLLTKKSNEKIEKWLKRIVKTAIANSRKIKYFNKNLEDQRFIEQRNRVVVFRSALSDYSTTDLIEKGDMTYTFSLSKDDYKIFIAYLMKKQNLEKEYAYNLYKQGLQDRYICISLTTLYMNAAFSFMKSEDVKKYFDQLFYDFLPYVKNTYNRVVR